MFQYRVFPKNIAEYLRILLDDARIRYYVNDSFQFAYTNINEEEKIISCDINPEVYWVQENLTINSCSGAVTSDVVVSSSEDYFSKTCYEGYTRNGRYYNGLSVNVKVNNLNDGIKYFDLDGGIGFPANIKLSTNVVCSYEFLYDQYQSDYSDLTKQLEETKDPKDRASLIMRLEAMDNILSTYLPLSNSDLVTYSNNFSKQKASLRITYDGSNEIDTINFVDSSEVSSNLRCETEMTRVINGRTLSVKENCYLSMSKEMSLPSVCVDMQTGEMVECDSSDSQIAGGNKFYTSLKEKSGRKYRYNFG